MNCPDCGRPLRPCPAWVDGEETSVGFFPCVCSWTVFLDHRQPGETYTEYRQRIGAPAKRPDADTHWGTPECGE